VTEINSSGCHSGINELANLFKFIARWSINHNFIFKKINKRNDQFTYPKVATILVFLLLKSIYIKTFSFLILVNSKFSMASSPYSSSPSSL